MPSRRLLYIGHDLDLLLYLQRNLADCQTIRSPGDSTVRILLARTDYSLLLFDEELSHMTGGELAKFNCSLERKPCTPFIIIKKAESFESIAAAIRKVFDGASS